MAQDMRRTTNCGPGCEIVPPTRNHYFTGKLLVERDFVDEQRYYMEKMRLHERLLHGTGVVCGLKVIQYENANCRDRFITIEPGLAIDCCGHEILVTERDSLDITQTTAYQALSSATDKTAHTVQVCIRYRECPTEEIPILYDDCSCDGIQRAPNRILESYELDLVLAKQNPVTYWHVPELAWTNTIGPANAQLAVFNAATKRAYVTTGSSATGSSDLFQIGLENNAPILSYDLSASANGLAVSDDGSWIYVTVLGTGNSPAQLLVLDQSKLTPVQSIPLTAPNIAGSNIDLSVAPTPDNRLIAVVRGTPTNPGSILVWSTDINSAGTPSPTTVTAAGVTTFVGPPVSGDGSTFYLLAPNESDIVKLDLTASPITAERLNIPLSKTSTPFAISVLPTAGASLLVVTGTDGLVQLIDPNASINQVLGLMPLGQTPIGVAVSPAGRWIYVLEKAAAGASQIQIVDGNALQTGSVTLSAPFPLAFVGEGISISDDGSKLYIPYPSDTDPATGGVAVISIKEKSCGDAITDSLDHCPGCEAGDCLTLATIENYQLNFQLLDPAVGTPDPTGDTNAGFARIDNRLGRIVLPSTQALTQVVECLLEEGGSSGLQGPPGATGATGPAGPAGPAGPGLLSGLTNITALSWTHNSNKTPPNSIDIVGIPLGEGNSTAPSDVVIVFSQDIDLNASGLSPLINCADFTQIPQPGVIEVLVPTTDTESPTLCRCPANGRLIPVSMKDMVWDSTGLITAPTLFVDPDVLSGAHTYTRALAFVSLASLNPKATSDDERAGQLSSAPASDETETAASPRFTLFGNVWVCVRGDFLIDLNGYAIDARFLNGKLPTGGQGQPLPPGDTVHYGIQGGIFESWFLL